MKEFIKIDNKRLSFKWYYNNELDGCPLYILIIHDRFVNKTPSLLKDIKKAPLEFYRLRKIAFKGHELGYSGKDLVNFIIKYKGLINEHRFINRKISSLVGQIAEMKFALQLLESKIKSITNNENISDELY